MGVLYYGEEKEDGCCPLFRAVTQQEALAEPSVTRWSRNGPADITAKKEGSVLNRAGNTGKPVFWLKDSVFFNACDLRGTEKATAETTSPYKVAASYRSYYFLLLKRRTDKFEANLHGVPFHNNLYNICSENNIPPTFESAPTAFVLWVEFSYTDQRTSPELQSTKQ